MSARWWTLVVWALAAASALFWGLKLFVAAPQAPAHTQLATPGAAAQGDLTRLLGADPVVQAVAQAEPAPDARFQLVGVVSPRAAAAAREGLALIAVDGKPPKAFRVGAVVEGQNVLQNVSARSVTLGPRGGAALVALDIAPPAPAATGMLPSAGGVQQGGMPQPMQVQPMQVQPMQIQPMQIQPMMSGQRPPMPAQPMAARPLNSMPNSMPNSMQNSIGQPAVKRPLPQQLSAPPGTAQPTDSDMPSPQGVQGRGALTQ